MRGHNFAISPNAFFARYSFISRPPNRGRRECRAPETCRFARRGKSPAPGRRIRAGASRMDRPADCLYSSTRRLIFFLKPSSCVQYATTGNPTKQSTAMSILRPRQIRHPDLSLAGVLKLVRGRYGTHLTSQSVQRKPGARADRQPTSDTVNPVCSNCQSDDIISHAVAQWSNESQEWQLASTFGQPAHCNSCNGPCGIVWQPLN
jgi:hypothetical protein